MARIPLGIKGGKSPSPSIEPYETVMCRPEALTANVLSEVPSADQILSGRQFIEIQNLTDSDVYVGSDLPDLYIWQEGFDKTISCTRKYLKWTESGAASDEYYVTTKEGTDPGLTEPLRMYGITTSGGSEAVLTEGTVSSLNDLEWVWNDGTAETPALGFNTIYFRFDAGDPDDSTFLTLYGYQNIPTVGTPWSGKRLGQYDEGFGSITSAVRLFAISSTTSVLVVTQYAGLIQL